MDGPAQPSSRKVPRVKVKVELEYKNQSDDAGTRVQYKKNRKMGGSLVRHDGPANPFQKAVVVVDAASQTRCMLQRSTCCESDREPFHP